MRLSAVISRFLISCSGADASVLDECPIDQNKHIGIGATIFLTSILSSLSGGYAIYFTFGNYIISIFFGILWGLIIFNLDRYIIISIKKTGKRIAEFVTALPRIAMAFILAISISKPLEIRLFEGSINQELNEQDRSYADKSMMEFNDKILSLNHQKSDLNGELNKKDSTVYSSDQILNDIQQRRTEAKENNESAKKNITYNSAIVKSNTWYENTLNPETGITTKNTHYNKTANIALNEIDKQKNQIIENEILISQLNDSLVKRKSFLNLKINLDETQCQRQLIEIQKQIDELNSGRVDDFKKIKEHASNDRDILSRIRALGKLQSEDNSVYWSSMLITILFLIVEIAPIAVKLTGGQSTYDAILERKEKEIIEKQKMLFSEYISKSTEDKSENDIIKKMREENRIKIEASKLKIQLNANDTIFKDIAKKQVHISRRKIDEWYREETENTLTENNRGGKWHKKKWKR